MKITWQQHKSLIIAFLTLVALLLTLLLISHIVMLGSYRHLEERHIERNVKRLQYILADETDKLDEVAGDWANWDESYTFLEDRNEKYRNSNLIPASFTQLRIDLILLVDTRGNIVYAGHYDRHTAEPWPIPRELRNQLPDLLQPGKVDQGLRGFFLLPKGPLLFAARPILTSEQVGPPRGALLMGRYLDSAEVARLAKLANLSFKLYRYADPRLPSKLQSVKKRLSAKKQVFIEPLNENTICGYTRLSDIFTQPALLLRIDMPREIYRQGKSTILYFLAWVAIIGLAAIVLIHWLLNKLALSRQGQERSEQLLAYLATHNSCTGLPNRTLLLDRISQALAQARRHNLTVAILQIDLDNFKVINESLGHTVGDLLLKTVAQRFAKHHRTEDTLAHLGGDDFVLVLPDLPDAQQAPLIAEKLLEALKEPFSLAGHELFITASIGITLAPLDGQNAEILIKNADIALYQAKAQGRNTYKFFAQEMNSHSIARLTLGTELRRGLEREEFLLYYQPRVDLCSGKIVGMEALVRWQHPERGLISPGEFIYLAEETGLILPLGEWILRTACAQNRTWQQAGLPVLRVSVNLSARQLRQLDLLERIEQILAETGLRPEHLELEITESILMENLDSTRQILTGLHRAGITLAMDDFGTGYSSLSYLKRFPFDLVKIDRSFVRDLIQNTSDAALVRTIIAMAENLNLKSVAEGVENAEQFAFLHHYGCDYVQGYYFTPPVPAEEFVRLLRSGFPSAVSDIPPVCNLNQLKD